MAKEEGRRKTNNEEGRRNGMRRKKAEGKRKTQH